jgi:Bacterial sugar transferase
VTHLSVAILGLFAVGLFIAKKVIELVLENEYASWAPALARLLVTMAGRMCPHYAEAWSADLSYIQGVERCSGIAVAATCVSGAPLICMRRLAKAATSEKTIKRAVDLLTASIALLLMAPALAVIAAAVRLTGPGPVVVPVMRVGKDGREFRMLRFRTRTVTAERARASQLGFWLLRLGLDELPAVLNIWRGELSLFGPRPA